MNDKTKKPKEPLLALLFSCLWGGLGQIYAGYRLRGILIILLPLMVGGGLVAYVVHPETAFNIVAMILLGISAFVFGIWMLVDSYLCAKRFNVRHNLERRVSKTKRILLICGILVVCFLPDPSYPIKMHVKEQYLQAFKYPSGSMRDTFMEGDRILADKRKPVLPRLKRGDIIVFKYPANPERDFVKRLIAFGGETVEIMDGDVYIDGNLVAEPKIKNIFYYNAEPYGKAGSQILVPQNYLFVLGDNSGSSHDSRIWGFVPEENVMGIIYKIYWPPERSGPVR